MAAGLKKPEFKVTGNIIENFKNFEVRLTDYCIQADYYNLAKDPTNADELADYHKKPQLEIAALRSALPDEALQVLRYTIEPKIAAADKAKPWIWLRELRTHYTGKSGSSLMIDRFTFWNTAQTQQESVQDWEVRVRQLGSICDYGANSDEMCWDKFVFGLSNEAICTELLKAPFKADETRKTLADMASEARAMETARLTNKAIVEKSQIHEVVHFTKHKDMRLKREPNMCHWCGDTRGPHPWRSCPAKGKTCSRCGLNDHFARVCLEPPRGQNVRRSDTRPSYNRKQTQQQPRQNHQSTHQLDEANHQGSHTSLSGNYHSTPADEGYYVEEDANNYYMYALTSTTSGCQSPTRFYATLNLLDHNIPHPLEFQIDAASSCNTVGYSQFRSLSEHSFVSFYQSAAPIWFGSYYLSRRSDQCGLRT